MSEERSSACFYLKALEYETLVGSGNWIINEIPLSIAAEIKDHFGIDTSFCLLASGIGMQPNFHAKQGDIIGGIDWVKIEDKPRSGETPLNVYHYVIGSETPDGFPVFYHGNKGALAPHWSTLNDLDVYFRS